MISNMAGQVDSWCKLLRENLDAASLERLALRIYSMESTFCYRDFARSSAFCRDELQRAGARNVRLIPLKADGRTAYGDFVMPEAWNVDAARLEIIQPAGVPDAVLADLKESSFCVANRCGPTPPQGIEAEVVHVTSLDPSQDLRGKMVFVDELWPGRVRELVIRQQGAGIISAFSPARDERQGIYWINGWGSGPGWYHQRDDVKLPCFSISPERGDRLRALLHSGGQVKVRARVQSTTGPGRLSSITGLLPGRRPGEILLTAHIFEPMLNDNATSAAALIEICRLLHTLTSSGELPPLEFGIRFLISMERYGTAQYFTRPRPEIMAAINADCISPSLARTGCAALRLKLSPFSRPFAGDYLFEYLLATQFPKTWPVEHGRAAFDDDTIISGPGCGIPTVYFSSSPGKLHHNSLDAGMVDWSLARHMTAIMADYAYLLASSDRRLRNFLEELTRLRLESELATLQERVECQALAAGRPWNRRESLAALADYMRPKIRSLRKCRCPDGRAMQVLDRWLRRENALAPGTPGAPGKPVYGNNPVDLRAANIVIRSVETYPFCLHRMPKNARIQPPAEYDTVLNWADGHRDLSEIFARVDWERAVFGMEPLGDGAKKELINFVELLARYGYATLRYKQVLTRAQLIRSLRRLGLRRGDHVVVHSSLALLGHVQGGARTVCSAFMQLISKDGLVLMPGFNHGVPFEPNGPGVFDPLTTPTINGAVPEEFRKMPRVYRSLDPTHSFSAWGRDARRFVENHHRVTTMGQGSPLELMEKAGGKIVIIGVPRANTFQHVVEMTNDVPCLGRRTEEYPVQLPSGKRVMCRTWGWRAGGCPVSDGVAYLAWLRKHKKIRELKIGHADVWVIGMRDCRRAIEAALHIRGKGASLCRRCNTRPRRVSQTVASDWDAAAGCVQPGTTAYVGPFETQADASRDYMKQLPPMASNSNI